MFASAPLWFRIRRSLTAVAGLGVFALAGCSADAGVDEQTNDYYHLAAGTVIEHENGFEVPREFAGLVVPRQSTDLAFERGGEIARIAVDEGNPVTAGQLLAELDTRLLRATRADLNARRLEIDAGLDLNKANRIRVEEMRTRGFAADQQIDELEAERRSLEAQLAQLAAELDANATRLDQSVLVAPFDGAVSVRLVDQGGVVAAGAPVLTVLEESDMEARVGVPVRMLGKLTVGDTVSLRIGGVLLNGRLLAIGTDVTRATLTVPVRISLPASIYSVAGDQAYLVLPEAVEETGFWIPMTALTDGVRGLWNVYVLDPIPVLTEGEPLYVLKARDVRVVWADENRAFVNGALADGERVVSAGLQRLVPGQQVRLDADAG